MRTSEFRGAMQPWVSPDWRARWWKDLQRENPEAARRLAAKFPGRYRLDG